MVDQERDALVDRAGVDQVIVVQHQEEVVPDRADLVEQHGEEGLDGRRPR